ncbi:hypothetical protein APV90_06365 [Staphylococcus aureus]|nr:hypothetical protein APV90_06365 [Staphylococcus aureus]
MLYYFSFDLYKNLVCPAANAFGIIFIIRFLTATNKRLRYWAILPIFLERLITLLVLHQMWWVYNLKNYFKLQLLEFLLLGGQSIIGLGCLLFFSFV